MSTPPTPRIVCDRYRMESELDRGGMGIVYAAQHLPTQRRVALKLVRDSNDPTRARARLVQEARSAAAIRHPHVVEVLDVGLDGDELLGAQVATIGFAASGAVLGAVGGWLLWRQPDAQQRASLSLNAGALGGRLRLQF